MTFEAWALFCLTELLLCLNPGPSVLVVISLAITRSRVDALLASVGVLAANAVYFALSASGLAALWNLSSDAFSAIRWAGAAYLIFLGARKLLRSFRGAPADAGAAPADTPARGRSFWQGFVTQASNPNLLVYFSAILPQFVDPKGSLSTQVAILAVSSFAIEFCVLQGYTVLSHRAGRRAAPRHRAWLERAGGALLIAAGAGLAALARG
jgi:threonine/homoserine/homoserine lactone efflux protein